MKHKQFISLITVIMMILSLVPVFPVEIINVFEANAVTSADLSISDNGIQFLCAREGFHSTCYWDYSQSSIGYGTKCTGSSTQPHASGSHSITKEKAMSDMRSVINSTYAPRVRNQTSGLTMTQSQFDALVSLCYNCGGGTTLISNSPLVKYLKGEITEAQARSQYSSYIVTAGGERLQGLVNRRNAEADLFFSEKVISLDTPVVSLKGATGDSLTFTWKKISGATGYKITFRKAGDDIPYDTLETNYSGTTYTVNGLNPNTRYWIRVYAVQGSKTSEKGQIDGRTAPNAPKIVVNSISSTSITIGWNKVSGATSYRIDRRLKGADAYETIAETTSTSYTDSGLSANTGYYYRVYAIGDNTISDKQGGYLVYTGSVSVPSVVLETLNSSSIKITWSKIDDADSYRVDRRIKGGDAYETIAKTKSTSFTDNGLEAATGYYYRVYAIQGDKTSEKQDGLLAYTGIDAPTVSLETVDTTSIKVSWNTVSNAASYRVERRPAGEEAYETLTTISGKNYVDTGLTPGKLYYYRVYAINGDVVSEKQPGIGAVTNIASPVLSTDKTTTDSITISWKSIDGAKSYRIDRRQKGAEEYEIIDTITETKFVDTGLEANTGYYYRVYAVGEKTNSEKQDGFLVYTESISSPKVNVEALSTSKIKVSWSEVSIAEYYIVDRRKYGADEYETIARVSGVEYTDQNLESGTGYYYRVYAVQGDSKSEKQDGVGTYTYKYGDVNLDGDFSVADVVLLQKWLLAVKDVELNCWQNADLCEDGVIDVFDMVLMRQLLIEQ